MNAPRRIATTALALLAGVTCATAQSVGVQVGNTLKLTLRGVPADDAAAVSGNYQVTDGGHIRLPHLTQRLRVAGLKEDQVSEAVEKAYRESGIYQRPTVETIIVIQGVPPEESASVSVGGHVARPGKVAFKRGLRLVEAIQGAGDRNPFGGRTIQVIRKGRLLELDFRKPEVKNFVLEPDDVITVKQRTPFEFDIG
jgi:protein involved in polysaccharide export with SLBB domain